MSQIFDTALVSEGSASSDIKQASGEDPCPIAGPDTMAVAGKSDSGELVCKGFQAMDTNDQERRWR
jgi:hypothetical protein